MAGTVTLTGSLQNILGVADAGGSVTVNLANYDGNVPRVIGTGILVVPSITVVATSGTFSISGLYRNDVISPANTFYEISFISDTGVRAKQAYQLLADGTFDVSTLTPLNSTVPVPPTIGIFTSTTPGLTPASGGGTANFLRADGVFALPGSGFTPFTPVTHQFLTGVSNLGVFSAAQPAASDLSNGVTGSGTVVLATSPTLVTPNIGAATALGIQQISPNSLSILDALGVSHFFISSSSPFTNTFVQGNGSGVVFLGSGAKTSVSDTTGNITMSGSSSGTTIIQASATASGTLTLPAATDTLVGKATTDTLTNKTFDTAGTGNVFKINGTQLTAVSGTGAVALVNSPSFTTPSIDVATGTSLTVTGNLSAGGFVHQSVSNANVTSVTVTGTTSQTALQAVTTASAELNTVGRWVTVRARGFHSTGATGGTITYTLKIGSTTLISIGSFNLANSLPNNAWYVEIDIMVQTAGASGALEVQANALLNNTASAAFFNSATISGIDLTGAVTFTLYSTASQTTTSTTSRMMGYQRNN